MDTTYISALCGFVYLTAVVVRATRRALAFRVSISLAANVAVEGLQEAFARYDVLEIINTDQGNQFTAHEFIDVLRERQIGISMDGKGCGRDNVFGERIWKTIKYEHVYLHTHESVSDARAKRAIYINFCNGSRPHSSIDWRMLDDVYCAWPPLKLAA